MFVKMKFKNLQSKIHNKINGHENNCGQNQKRK